MRQSFWIFVIITEMSAIDQGLVTPGGDEHEFRSKPGAFWDWPSVVMLIMAVAILVWSFWPVGKAVEDAERTVGVGQTSPGLWCVVPGNGEPLLGMTPRGWFVWMVIGPADLSEKNRLQEELEKLEQVWAEMADLDRWRRVVIVADQNQGVEMGEQVPAPAMIPYEVGLATKRTWATWGQAGRVRHVLIEPSGRILMIEPSEEDQPGVLKRISEEIRRRLRAWEGNFDDQPKFSSLGPSWGSH